MTTTKKATKAVKKAAKKPAKKTVKKATKKAAKKTAKDQGNLLLPIRMSHDADRLLRTSEKAYQIGNLTARVIAAVEGVDLKKIPVEDRPRIPGLGKDYAITTVKLPKEVKELLSKVADARGTSMSALIDGAVRKFYK